MISRNFIVITAGRIVQIGVSLLAVRLFTGMLSTAEVGNLYLINSIAAFFGFTLLNPVGMYINRKLNKWVEERTLLSQFFLYNLYLLLVAAGSAVVVLFMNRVLHIGTAVDLGMLIIFVMLYIYFNTWNQTVTQTLNLLDHRVLFVLFTVATSVLGLAFSILLARNTPTAVWWLTGQCGAQIAITAVAFLWLRRLIGSKVSVPYMRSVATGGNIRHVLNFVAPLAFTTFLVWTQTQSYRMVVENRIGLEFLGLMGLGFSIAANIAAAVESIVQQVYFPVFYRELYGADQVQRAEACNRMIRMTLPFYLSLTLFVSCTAPFLVNLLAHNKFSQAYWFVIYGAWIEMFRMITSVLSTAAHAEMQTRHLVKSYVVGGAAVAVGVYAATFSASYELVIPLVLLAAGFLGMVVMYRDMRRVLPIKVGIRTVCRSAVVSIPFLSAIFLFRLRTSLPASFVITGLLGGYFLLSQYLMYRTGTAAMPQQKG